MDPSVPDEQPGSDPAEVRRSLHHRRPRRTGDLRALVVVVALSVFALSAAALLAVWLPTRQVDAELHRLVESLAPPKDHLLEAERANDDAQAALAGAVAVSGPERTDRLSAAIDHSRRVSSEWSKYVASAVGLPGEAALTARYRRHQAAATAASSAVLVPILNSEVVGSLPTDELSTHDAVRADLIALHRLYRQADHRALKELGDQSERFATMLRVGAVVLLVLLATGTIVALRKAQRAMVRRGRQRKDAELAEFETQLRRALEFVDSDVGALAVAERAVRQALPDAHASLLVADASRARFEPVKDPPVCGVARPADCPAMRASAALTFVDSRRLDACPQLAAATSTPCSATCVPVTIAGRGAAVIHLAGEAAEPPDPDAIADLVARGVGERVTLLQAFATFQLQAERDPLTGLLNRRSLDSAVARLVEDGGGYAVAFGDLDHFKRLNDLHGHDAGDRALRSFARVLSESFRPEDVVCRWGGEEFVIVLPGCDVEQAVDATERVRTNLALGFIDGQAHAVTVSFGIAGSSGARTFDEVVDQADRALRRAKLDGRNRTVTFDAAASPLPDASEAASEPSR